jgi:DNA polymerase-3 subunit delta
VKLEHQALARFLRAPEPGVIAVLLYGPDSGLVHERAEAIVKAAAGDPDDPFRVSPLTPADLREEPARLADEAAALPFTGGRRVVHLRDATDGLAPLFEALLAGPPPPGLVVAEAGDLPPKSALRALFGNAAQAALVPCYHDEGDALGAMVAATLREAGLAVEAEARDYLVANLGGDRALTRRELEKLALYKGSGTVTLDDALATVGDTAARGMDDLVFDLADGSLAALDRDLERQLAEGDSPVSILRAAARHFLRLHVAAGAVARGEAPARAMALLRPPVFVRNQNRFRRQLERWSVPALAAALSRLIQAEIDCKTTGYPAEAICRRTLAQIAAGARR